MYFAQQICVQTMLFCRTSICNTPFLAIVDMKTLKYIRHVLEITLNIRHVLEITLKSS